MGYDPNSPESNIMFEFVQDRNLTKSIEFAKMLQKNVCRAASRPDKGVHQSNLAVLRLTSMPACLVELGFITTADEEALLNDRNRLDQMAVGIYNAFVEYKNKNYNGISVPYRTDSPMLPETPAQEPANTAETQDDASARQQPEQRTVAETTPQQHEQQTSAPQPHCAVSGVSETACAASCSPGFLVYSSMYCSCPPPCGRHEIGSIIAAPSSASR